jgi:protocatechuate 3,4-dioxygenase alpha subunit
MSRDVASPSQTVGPFFHVGLTTDAALGRIAPPDAPGEHINLRVRVLDGDGAPVPDALIEVYQADGNGVYAREGEFNGFGRLPTGEDGVCVFETVRPGLVTIADSDGLAGYQAPHINVCVFARGLLRHLYTRIYFAGDPGIETDPILALVTQERKNTLIAVPSRESMPMRAESRTSTPESRLPSAGALPATWDFLIRLQGENETVFFDV